MKFSKILLLLIIPLVVVALFGSNIFSVSTVLLGIKGTITDGNLIKFSGTAGVGEDAGVASSNVTKNKFDAVAAPTVDNDIDEGYTVGSRWLDVTNGNSYVCFDNADGVAVWELTSPVDILYDFVKEENTSSLIEGQAVYVSGAAGANTLVGIADNTNSAKIRVLGLCATDIDQNGKGYVVVHGIIHDIDTRKDIGGINDEAGVDWSASDLLYVNSNGKLTSTRPTSGRIIKAAYSLEGSGVNDDLLVVIHENPVNLSAASGEDIIIRMGDSAGSNKTIWKDYDNNDVATMDSDGEILSFNVKRNKLDATAAPTVNNDVDEGYAVGSYWLDVTNDLGFVCLDSTDGAAVWIEMTSLGTTTFTGLTDTPVNYTGEAGKYAKVNVGEDALEFGTPASYTNLTSFVDQTAWRLFYSNADGDVVEMALGTDGKYFMSNGPSVAPTFELVSGETNTASNIGSQIEIFKQKTGVDLEFRTLKANSDKLTISVTPDTPTIDVGPGATDRTGSQSSGSTRILLNNPANLSGIITSIEIWANESLSNVEVATFYLESGSNYSTRDNETIGSVTSGSKQIFSVSLDVTAGDFIGMYWTAGKMENSAATDMVRYLVGDNIPCTDETFGTTNSELSLYGIGFESMLNYIKFDVVESEIRLDDLKETEDNTDLNASTTAHGLMPKLPFSGDLLSTTTVAFNADADTTLYTVPTGKRCVLSHAIVVAAGDAGAGTTVSIGQNTAETDFIPANTLSNLDAQYDSVILMPIPNTTPLKTKSYAAATVIEAQVASQSGVAGNTIYLFGILY